MYAWIPFINKKGGVCINVSTAVTSFLSEWLRFVKWLWNFADSIIIYQNITLLDIIVFAFVVSMVLEVVLWVNSKSVGGDE